jgi:glycerol-3-phosphate dehydrogenase (NAD(P)+)
MTGSFAVLGAGGWGTAVAVHLGRLGHTVTLWGHRSDEVEELHQTRENRRLLPHVPIPEGVRLTADPAAAAEAETWISAVPTAFLRGTLNRFVGLGRPGVRLLSLTKGIEADTFQRPSEVARDLLGISTVAVLSGPSHAEEMAKGLPTSVVVACGDSGFAGWLQSVFTTERFRVYTNTDVAGVELAGALKNVIGIAAGVCDGLKLGDNAKSALVTRGLVEMTRFGVAHGAEPATFGGLAGVGDLITTCFSKHGRNRRVGERLAAGEPIEAVLAGPQVAEGVYTARSVYVRSQQMGLDVPIMAAVYGILYDGMKPAEAVRGLMSRRTKGEL